MTVTVAVSDFIATVTLNRPEAMNAIDPESAAQLREAWREISCRDDVRVGVPTGVTSENAFSPHLCKRPFEHRIARRNAVRQPCIQLHGRSGRRPCAR